MLRINKQVDGLKIITLNSVYKYVTEKEAKVLEKYRKNVNVNKDSRIYYQKNTETYQQF